MILKNDSQECNIFRINIITKFAFFIPIREGEDDRFSCGEIFF